MCDYLKHVFGIVFRHIETVVEDKMSFRKIPKVHKLRMVPTFKNYHAFFRPQEAAILTKCIEYFMDLDTSKEIGFY